MSLPPDWRERFVAMVAGRAPMEAAWFTGGPALTPEQQGAIYPRQYQLRLHDGLRAELVGTVACWPDLPWDDLFRRYLLAVPPTSFTLNRVADGFAAWWSADGATDAQLELATLDALVSRAFEAADPIPYAPGAPVRLAPAVGLLRLTHDVHQVRHELLTGGPRREPVAATAGVLVYRATREVRHWQPPPPLFLVLEALARGDTLTDAITAPFLAGLIPYDELLAALPGWMSEVAERELLSAA